MFQHWRLLSEKLLEALLAAGEWGAITAEPLGPFLSSGMERLGPRLRPRGPAEGEAQTWTEVMKRREGFQGKQQRLLAERMARGRMQASLAFPLSRPAAPGP